MNYTNLAIEKMVEGGYTDPRPTISAKEKEDEATCIIMDAIMKTQYNFMIWLDPLAWQALGRVEEWNHWGVHQHDLIDHIQDELDVESFFKKLLK